MSSGGLHCEIRRALRLLARCWKGELRRGRMTNQRADAMCLISEPSFLPPIHRLPLYIFNCRLSEYVIINSGLVKRSEEETVTCIVFCPARTPISPLPTKDSVLWNPPFWRKANVIPAFWDSQSHRYSMRVATNEARWQMHDGRIPRLPCKWVLSHQIVRSKLPAFVLLSSISAFVLNFTSSCSLHMLPSRPTNTRIRGWDQQHGKCLHNYPR